MSCDLVPLEHFCCDDTQGYATPRPDTSGRIGFAECKNLNTAACGGLSRWCVALLQAWNQQPKLLVSGYVHQQVHAQVCLAQPAAQAAFPAIQCCHIRLQAVLPDDVETSGADDD